MFLSVYSIAAAASEIYEGRFSCCLVTEPDAGDKEYQEQHDR